MRISMLFAMITGISAIHCSASDIPPQAESLYGIGIQVVKPNGETGRSCAPPSTYIAGESTLLVDGSVVDGKHIRPDLWISTRRRAGDQPALVEVYEAYSYRLDDQGNETIAPLNRKNLKSIEYSLAFGSGAKKDSFEIFFNEKNYRFEVTGIPEGGQCPNVK